MAEASRSHDRAAGAPRSRALRGWQAVVALALAGCCAAGAQSLSGRITTDGSSTVAPLMAAAAELFRREQPGVQIPVGTSGTGGGFKKFLDERADLRIDVANASRPITRVELEQAAARGVEFIELVVALDGISVVVNPRNTFCEHLTVEELKRIWEPGSAVKNWSQVRAGFPDRPLKLFGPGPDSGTFDFFTEAIMGRARASRSDYTASENDNLLVQGVAGEVGGLGYFGHSYYEVNRNRLKLVAIDPGDGRPVLPTLETIRDGSYRPLSRPLLIYVNRQAAARPEVAAFVRFLLNNAERIAQHPRVNFVALERRFYEAMLQRFEHGVTGTVLGTAEAGGKPLAELYGVK